MENVNGYVILKEVAEKLLSEKAVLSTLSFPAKRVLYAGRSSGRWYTKSKTTHDEIMAVYKRMSPKPEKTTSGSIDPEMVKKTIQDLDRILKILASYGK